MAEFQHAEKGMSRFPPNVENVTVEHETNVTWLKVRRNDVRLELPLRRQDCEHLAKLLLEKPSS